MKLTFPGIQNNGKIFTVRMNALAESHSKAIGITARKAAASMRLAISADIRSAGNFGPKWKSAVKVETEADRDGALITVRYSSSPLGAMAAAFEDGATIAAKSGFMFIPFSDGPGVHVKPKNFPGGLQYVQGSGRPLLLSKLTRKPVYFGVPSITEPKLFDIQGMVMAVAQRIPAIYAETLAQESK